MPLVVCLPQIDSLQVKTKMFRFLVGYACCVSQYVFSCCLSNAMHGQNINLPVCVSVSLCVCHTFRNSPTGQTPQQIFTVDSLQDADLRKDVPFGGLDDE